MREGTHPQNEIRLSPCAPYPCRPECYARLLRLFRPPTIFRPDGLDVRGALRSLSVPGMKVRGPGNRRWFPFAACWLEELTSSTSRADCSGRAEKDCLLANRSITMLLRDAGLWWRTTVNETGVRRSRADAYIDNPDVIQNIHRRARTEGCPSWLRHYTLISKAWK